MSDVEIFLPVNAFRIPKVVDHCEWRIKTFLERDAFGSFDYAATLLQSPSDAISLCHVKLINDAMRARSSLAAWRPIIDSVEVETLSKIPISLDLIDSNEEEVRQGLEVMRKLVQNISSTPGITDMAASKVLHLLRPKFVAISDSYVRLWLGVSDKMNTETSKAGSCTNRFIRVQEEVRQLGLANLAALNNLVSFVGELQHVTPKYGRFNGQAIPARLTKVRILDILMWTHVATHRDPPDMRWSKWYREEVGYQPFNGKEE